MRRQAEIFIMYRKPPLFLQRIQCQETAFGLAHLAGLVVQKFHVHPEIHPFMTEVRFTLGNLVFVVNRNMVYAAAMDIYAFAEIFGRHGGTFNVPPWITSAPRAVPLQNLVLKFGGREP